MLIDDARLTKWGQYEPFQRGVSSPAMNMDEPRKEGKIGEEVVSSTS
jgi:hypothetical protein